jgi:hypothetical protein
MARQLAVGGGGEHAQKRLDEVLHGGRIRKSLLHWRKTTYLTSAAAATRTPYGVTKHRSGSSSMGLEGQGKYSGVLTSG